MFVEGNNTHKIFFPKILHLISEEKKFFSLPTEQIAVSRWTAIRSSGMALVQPDVYHPFRIYMILGNRIIYGLKFDFFVKLWLRLNHLSIFDSFQGLDIHVEDKT